MNDVYLTRIEPAKNMARYYAMSLQPNLFGEWSLVREWGRIGRGGQVHIQTWPSEGEAELHLAKLLASKIRRGYNSGHRSPAGTSRTRLRADSMRRSGI